MRAGISGRFLGNKRVVKKFISAGRDHFGFSGHLLMKNEKIY